MDLEATHGPTVSRSLKRLRRLKFGTLLVLLLMATITLVSTTLYPAIQHNVLPLGVILGMSATTTVLFVIWLALFFAERKKKRHGKLHIRYYYENPSPPARNLPGGRASSQPRPSLPPSDKTLPAVATERAAACWHFLRNSAGSAKDACFGAGGGGVVLEQRARSTSRPVAGKAGTAIHHQAQAVGSHTPPDYSYYRLEENTRYPRAEAAINGTSVADDSKEFHGLYTAHTKDIGKTHTTPQNSAARSVGAAAQPQTRGLRVGTKAANRTHRVAPQDIALSSLEIRGILEPPYVNPPFPDSSFDQAQHRGSRTPTQEGHPKVVPPVRPRTADEHGTSYHERQQRMQQNAVSGSNPVWPDGNQRLKSGAADFGYHHGYGGK
jgi:hypothetical protein